MRDLSSLDVVTGANEGFELELYNPATQEDLGIFITVLGKDSTEFRKLQAEQNQRRLDRAGRAGNVSKMLSERQIRADGIELDAACTKSWRTVTPDADGETEHSKSVILVAGTELECTKQNAIKLYTDFPWIKEQVDEAILDRANFMKR
jgi:hypothetical protein